MLDFVIRNANVIDGTGSPAFLADVAIRKGKIAAVGTLPQTDAREVNACGLTLAPGFIDSHSHGDMMLDLDDTFFQELEQGVTTQAAGMCGISAAPFSKEHTDSALEIVQTVVPCDFGNNAGLRFSYEKYLSTLKRPLGTNLLLFVGHGTLRAAVMGMENRRPTPGELTRMQEILHECMEAGAAGISYGLQYPPGAYADITEMCALSSVAARFGGITSAHVRDEGNKLLESNEEMIAVARASGSALVISHHKAIHAPNWGKTAQTIPLLEAANASGCPVFCDLYPYSASSTGLKSRIPQSMHALGETELLRRIASKEERPAMRNAILMGMTPEERFETTMFGASPSHPEYTGRMVCEVAYERMTDPCELVMDVLYDDHLGTNGIYLCMHEEDVERVMRWDHTMFGSDGLYYKGCSGTHPRAFGSFTRVLGRYVRERHVLTLEEAIRRMTSLPASVYHLSGKGIIRSGMDADLVLFNPDTVTDHATFTDFAKRGEGIKTVWLAGLKVVEDGVFNGRLCGELLLH
ncbi:MAG: D-aminoacylase [Lachnospiraceae bacterium]|jgi:N-acyl-D-amino-acid deacylase|nr:D-aminoacylase [Lachnospiraceae bacterium]